MTINLIKIELFDSFEQFKKKKIEVLGDDLLG